VLAQQVTQLPARGLAVVGTDRRGDVGLVLEQAGLRRLEVRQAAGEAHDRQARPGDVVFPELAHAVVQARGLGAAGGRGGRRGVVVRGLGARAARGGEAHERGGRCGGERHPGARG
jgi:hypothetical protein